MNFKLKVLSASVAFALANTASAGLLGAANEIFVGGATAPQTFFREDILLRVCDGKPQVFADEIETAPSSPAATTVLKVGDHVVVRCTTKTGFANPALDGQDIAIYKFNGGSATGVAPVVDATPISILDATLSGPSACTPVAGGTGSLANEYPIGTSGRVYELYVCSDASLVKAQIPDAGISDVEPTLFKGALALNFGVEPRGVSAKPDAPFVDRGNLQLKAGPGLTFGTAVTIPMYDELQDDQAAAGMLPDCPPLGAGGTDLATRDPARDTIACMPSLPSPLIRSVFLGQITSWADFMPYGLELDPTRVAKGNDVHVCKRTNGSGTHAQFSVNFLGTNCRSVSNLAMVEQNDGLSSSLFGVVGVYGNSGSSDMSDCLDALATGKGFDGDFDGLPPESFPGTGDSTVVPGEDLAATAIPGDPLGRGYNDKTEAYAMGYQSLENNPDLAFSYRFVKVDGVAPTLDNVVAGTYKDVYYLTYQNRVAGGSADLKTGAVRTSAPSAAQVAVANAYFETWNSTAAAAITAVNALLAVDPDGTPGNGDEWETGFVTPTAGASLEYTSGIPETAFARQTLSGAPDSCQDLGLVR
ncbi:MAG: hypothetical protein KDK91_23125 [Gammaproteobacteria bacterium]|nr:hypothetical protein [Gammaproteobacteria bacterium]